MEKIYINNTYVGGVYMEIKNMKNMIVLKNLPSNMVEEAFVVLKDNIKIHKEELASNNKVKNISDEKVKDKDYIIKEAEMIVSEYVSKLEKKQSKTTKEKIKLEEKCKRLKYLNIFFACFSFLSVIAMLLR